MLLGMAMGGLVGAVSALHGSPALPLLLAFVVLAGGTVAAFALTRSDADWTSPL
ncbi:hypothetical protein I2W78_13065 [Streptomyces spinoverrucosus]|uniref:hypothetical protein n=1 Tax=Streptomyces spinoverrucosus TaxID=284043 RepID=UPI0018C3CF21|nr:hypothetical protein [Streptomyces spinoverrucosus]MBG0852745.1 hypothetical protein [Streptomyces spinoverrucosus]